MHSSPAFRALAGMVVVAALAGCSGIADEKTSGVLAQMRLSENRWIASNVRTYSIVMTRVCSGCPGLVGSAVRVEVVNGVVTGQFMDDTGEPIPTAARESYPGVDGLFAVIRQSAQRSWKRLNVHYDDDLGFPTLFLIDFDGTRTSDDLVITVLGFTR